MSSTVPGTSLMWDLEVFVRDVSVIGLFSADVFVHERYAAHTFRCTEVSVRGRFGARTCRFKHDMCLEINS